MFWKKKPHLLLVRENIKALLINWFEIEKTDSTKQETMKKALGRKQDTLFCMKKKNIRQTNRKKETKKFCCCWLEKERNRGKEREKKEREGKKGNGQVGIKASYVAARSRFPLKIFSTSVGHDTLLSSRRTFFRWIAGQRESHSHFLFTIFISCFSQTLTLLSVA